MSAKQIPLHHIHESLGAKMIDFAGYLMPVRYTSDKEEHLCVRQKLGVFDVSHMGEFLVEGEHALDLIQKVSSNDAAKLVPGKAQYAYLPNDQGGIVDDCLIYQLSEKKYMIVVNASNIDKDWNWIQKHNQENVSMKNISDTMSLLAVQGPKAIQALQELTSIDLTKIPYYSFEIGEFAGVEKVIISATGYTGAGGFELYIPNENVEQVWHQIFAAGEKYGIQAIGLGARDTLRLEMGYCLYGNDINDATSPFEAGLGWVTKFTKPFIHSEALKAQKEAGITRKLIGFKMIEKGIPRSGYELLDQNKEIIGRVSSGSLSPVLDTGIGLGYLKKEFTSPGTSIFVQVRNKLIEAQVIQLPFIKKTSI